jgi:hypothetical protein
MWKFGDVEMWRLEDVKIWEFENVSIIQHLELFEPFEHLEPV